MPITRTPMIDDDGSGTTGTIINNAWKQELYGQIDGIGTPQTAFSPTDTSGAGLVFVVNAANYIRIGNLVSIQLELAYPANSNPSQAAIALPFFCLGNGGGFYSTGGVVRQYLLLANTNQVLLYDTNGLPVSNASLANQGVAFAGVYQAL